MNKLLNVGVVILAFQTGCNSPSTNTDPGGGSSGGSTTSTSTTAPVKPGSGSGTSSPVIVATPSPSPSASAAPVIQPPTMSVGNKAGSEASALSFVITANDPQSQSISYSCSGCPVGLSVNASSGAISWTPSFGQAGTYNVSFVATNTSSLSVSAASQIVIAHTDRAPVLNAIGAKSVNEGQVLNITPSYSDPDSGDTLVLSITSSLPANSTFSGGVFSYSPGQTDAGQVHVVFQVSDGTMTASEDVIVTVNSVNVAPVMSAVSNASVAQQATMSFSVSASDVDGDTLTYSASNLPAGATFNTSTHQFSWTPACNTAGAYTPTFSVSDPGGLIDSKTPTLTVTATDCYSPTWFNNPTLSSQSGNNASAFIGSGQDLDSGDVLTYGYVQEAECNNVTWTKSLNTSTKTLSVTNPSGCSDMGMHTFVVYTQDSGGLRNYRFVQLTGCTGSFTIQFVNKGSTYSTAGLCGAGTVYIH